MSDLPIEQTQHDVALDGFTGSVLVAGLGIGYAANVLAANSDVDDVTIVEISPEVVQLVGPHIRDPDGKVEIVTDDIFNYLHELVEGDWFDFCFFDI